MQHFRLSFFITIVCLGIAVYWGGPMGAFIALILGVLEVSLSFDNAVVNASILKRMDERWQQYFLTWGILIAVFGMRLLFPILIVNLATGIDFMGVVNMALHDSTTYSQHLNASHVQIAAFGGMFLLMVFFSFIFDAGKDLHWLGFIERKIVDSLSALFEDEEEGEEVSEAIKKGSVMSFLYLEILDASFSFDGVIGAFAITQDVIIIMLGLAIGAMFVRSLTVYLVRKGTLDEYVFLEHGAHYAIGSLATIMLLSINIHISEVITGLIGAVMIGLSVLSSIFYKRKLAKQA